jgi:hypothetical protein
MATTRQAVPVPPYVAFSTFLNALDWLEKDGLPQRFDETVWRKRLSGAYSAQMMAACRALGLTRRDGTPTEALEQLVFSPAQRRTILAQVIRAAYPSLFAIDLTKASSRQVEERLRDLGLQGDTLRKATTFFVHACQHSGIALSPFITRRTKSRSGKRTSRSEEPVDTPGHHTFDQPPAIAALLSQLSEKGRSWTTTERELWLRAWTAVVNMEFPAVEGGGLD